LIVLAQIVSTADREHVYIRFATYASLSTPMSYVNFANLLSNVTGPRVTAGSGFLLHVMGMLMNIFMHYPTFEQTILVKK
jgi:hypothetical protein